MTLELFSYIILCFISILFAYKEGKFSNMESLPRKVFAFSIGIVWFIIVRNSGFDIDINTYVSYLDEKATLLFLMNSSYFLREFVFWGSFIGGYMLVQDKILILLLIDIFILYFLIKTITNLRLPFYSFFLLLCFFPNLMGYENIYRQYIATILTLYAFSIAYKEQYNLQYRKNIKSYIFLIIAGFCHNVSFLFFPLLFFLKGKIKLGILSSFVIYIALPFISSSKSEVETGDVPVYFFFIVIIILYFFYILINFLKINKTSLSCLLFILILTLESVTILTGAASKRIIMFSLNIILLFIILSLQKSNFNIKSYRLIVVLLCLSMLAPTFLSNSSFQMLLTNNK